MIGRFALVYLLAYTALVVGAYVNLWRAGVLGSLPRGYVVLAGLCAVLLGVLFTVAFRPKTKTE